MASLNADPENVRFFPRAYTLEETRAQVEAWSGHFSRHGFGPWAVEAPGIAACIGAVGTAPIGGNIPLAGRMEILWRLVRRVWGKGYAVEAAQASLRDAFERFSPAEIIALTAAVNLPSRRVMEKLGMSRDDEAAFFHPGLEEGHVLRPHVVYRLTRESFRARGAAASESAMRESAASDRAA
jgi:RimJ/RimL family protein N-acetyltransferase